ncbi:hypothetical protein MBLNU230_g6039t1 [Neophaeotheca triangularis]
MASPHENPHYQPNSQPSTSNTTWTKAVEKGQRLYELLTNPQVDDQQSKWQSFEDLASWGWKVEDHSGTINLLSLVSLKSTYQAVKSDGGLGIDGEDDDPGFCRTYVQHKIPADVLEAMSDNPRAAPRETQTYTPSVENVYCNAYLTKYGAIIAIENKGPSHSFIAVPDELKPRQPKQAVTPLHHWSDVVFLVWQAECLRTSVDPQTLDRVVRAYIQNEETRQIIDQACSIGGEDVQALKPWPGTKFELDGSDDRAKALLSTPNGVGVAHLLFQHRGVLGHKTVKSITAFASDRNMSDCHLMFEIVDIRSRRMEESVR